MRSAVLGAVAQDGVHVLTRPDNMTGDLYKVLKTQDLGYVHTVAASEEKVTTLLPCGAGCWAWVLSHLRRLPCAQKVDALMSTLHFLGAAPQGKHTVFVEDEDEVAPAATSAAAAVAEDHAAAPLTKKAKKATEQAYTELSKRIDRVDKLHKARDHLTMQRQLLVRGRVRACVRA